MVRLQLSGVEKLETKVISHFDEDDDTGEDDSCAVEALQGIPHDLSRED